MVTPVYIVDLIGEVVAATNTALRADSTSRLAINNLNINYVYGGKNHVWKALQDTGTNPKALENGVTKYPFFGLNLPIGTGRGQRAGDYPVAIIPSIFIATISNNTSLPSYKYANNIKPVLFPIYLIFLQKLSQHPNVVIQGGADGVEHEVWEYPADVAGPVVIKQNEQAFPESVDVLVIQNLRFPIRQTGKVC